MKKKNDVLLFCNLRMYIKWGPTGIAGGSPYAPVRLHYQPRPSRRIFGLTFAFLLLATRKRVSWYRKF